MTPDELIAEREKTHGDFSENARIVQGIKALLRASPSWNDLSSSQCQALDCIALKMARAVSNGGRNPDDFIDIGGYARLGELSTHERSDKKQETTTFGGDASGYSCPKKMRTP